MFFAVPHGWRWRRRRSPVLGAVHVAPGAADIKGRSSRLVHVVGRTACRAGVGVFLVVVTRRKSHLSVVLVILVRATLRR